MTIAESELSARSGAWGAALEFVEEPVAITDSCGDILWLNTSFCKTLGLDESSRRGSLRSYLQVTDPSDGGMSVWHSIETASPWAGSGELRTGHSDRTAQVEIQTTPHFAEISDEALTLWIFKSMRGREFLQERLARTARMEAIGSLAGGVAHDFNNLLTGILGCASLLRQNTASDEKSRRLAETIETAGMRASELAKKLLLFCRGEKSSVRNVDVHQRIAEVSDLLGRTVDKNIQIIHNLGATRSFISGDPPQVLQVILNLAVNACDAMPGGGSLVFSTANFQRIPENAVEMNDPQATGLRLSVSDSGVGMESSIVNRIFDPLFTTKENGKGTGLGLAMVRGIMESCGGTIDVESGLGRGTTFHLYFPRATDGQTARTGAPAREVVGGQGCILLIDDEPVVLDTAGDMLRSLGYRVLTACDGMDALERVRQGGDDIELVILDLIMPRMNGSECFRRLNHARPGIRVVLSTGYGLNNVARDLLNQGAVGFIPKPYEMSQLSKTVAAAIRR